MRGSDTVLLVKRGRAPSQGSLCLSRRQAGAGRDIRRAARREHWWKKQLEERLRAGAHHLHRRRLRQPSGRLSPDRICGRICGWRNGGGRRRRECRLLFAGRAMRALPLAASVLEVAEELLARTALRATYCPAKGSIMKRLVHSDAICLSLSCMLAATPAPRQEAFRARPHAPCRNIRLAAFSPRNLCAVRTARVAQQRGKAARIGKPRSGTARALHPILQRAIAASAKPTKSCAFGHGGHQSVHEGR